ncbi:hypothetical protein [Blastococcus sp. CCUG 61487]|uniref:hypothetical protein n=1 Tax=Blastococcus sp. CCUG 61487 TaxID=1840703 RepID=UPI0010C0DCB6|nr:hypothetical protein [Blastococcus sp. CCUG 61487]
MADPYDRLATRHAARQGQLSDRTIAQLGRLWAAVTDHGDPAQLAAFVGRASTVVRSAELATGRLTEAYLRQVLRQLGVTVPASTLVNLPASLRGGVTLEEVLLRPAATVRYLQSTDVPLSTAAAEGLRRLGAIAATNLQLALTQATVNVLSQTPGTGGYRRILRPYLSRGGSCGLCIAAADRIYGRGDLMPIHAKCKCAVMPITRAGDPGLRLNQRDLDQLYRAAGDSTEGAELKRTRYRVERHGELGPVLVPAGQRFRGVDDVAASLAS